MSGALVGAPVASAHIDIVSPASRYGPEMIKDAPCGHPDNPPGVQAPHVYEVGQTITIVVDEFVAHMGHLRVAWAENDEDIVTVNGFDDFDNFPGVLVDNIADAPGSEQFNIEVTLPDAPCDNCTLQVIQVMYDNDGFQENDLYYTCADITLVPVGAGTGVGETGADTDGDTTSDSGDSTGAETEGSVDGTTAGGPRGDTAAPSGSESGGGLDGASGTQGSDSSSGGTDGLAVVDDGAADGCACSSTRHDLFGAGPVGVLLMLLGMRHRREAEVVGPSRRG